MIWLTLGTGRGGMELAMRRIARDLDPTAEVLVLPNLSGVAGRVRNAYSVRLALRRQPEPTVINAFGASTALVANLAAVGVTSVKRVSWIRNSLHDWGSGTKSFLIRKSVSSSELVVSVSNTVAAQLRDQGIDSLLLRNTAPSVSAFPERQRDADHYVWLGRLGPAKSPSSVLEAYLKADVDAPLLVAGEGPWRPALEQTYRSDLIRFLGNVTDVGSVLVGARALLFSSRYEGMPNAILEAFAWSVPVVAQSAPGVDEVLGYGKYGHLVDNHEDFVSAIARLEDEKDDLRQKLADMSYAGSRAYAPDAAPIRAERSMVQRNLDFLMSNPPRRRTHRG